MIEFGNGIFKIDDETGERRELKAEDLATPTRKPQKPQRTERGITSHLSANLDEKGPKSPIGPCVSWKPMSREDFMEAFKARDWERIWFEMGESIGQGEYRRLHLYTHMAWSQGLAYLAMVRTLELTEVNENLPEPNRSQRLQGGFVNRYRKAVGNYFRQEHYNGELPESLMILQHGGLDSVPSWAMANDELELITDPESGVHKARPGRCKTRKNCKSDKVKQPEEKRSFAEKTEKDLWERVNRQGRYALKADGSGKS